MLWGFEHRRIQTCERGHEFMWSPGPGLCPYCDLSDRARQSGPYGNAQPCPDDCCPPESP